MSEYRVVRHQGQDIFAVVLHSTVTASFNHSFSSHCIICYRNRIKFTEGSDGVTITMTSLSFGEKNSHFILLRY